MKIIKIEDCGGCPYYEMLPTKNQKGIVEEWCNNDGWPIKINNSFVIPSWCPLEDYKEADHD